MDLRQYVTQKMIDFRKFCKLQRRYWRIDVMRGGGGGALPKKQISWGEMFKWPKKQKN